MNEAAFLQINNPMWVPDMIVIWPGVSGSWKIFDREKIGNRTVYLWENLYIEDMGFILSGDRFTGFRMLAEDVYACTVSEALKDMDMEEILEELATEGKIDKVVDLSKENV